MESIQKYQPSGFSYSLDSFEFKDTFIFCPTTDQVGRIISLLKHNTANHYKSVFIDPNEKDKIWIEDSEMKFWIKIYTIKPNEKLDSIVNNISFLLKEKEKA